MPSNRILKTLNDHYDHDLENKQVKELSCLLRKAKVADDSPLLKAIFLIQRIKVNDLQRQIHNLCDQLDASDREIKSVMQDNLKLRGLVSKQVQRKPAQRKKAKRK